MVLSFPLECILILTNAVSVAGAMESIEEEDKLWAVTKLPGYDEMLELREKFRRVKQAHVEKSHEQVTVPVKVFEFVL